jgi:hypothetical protein
MVKFPEYTELGYRELIIVKLQLGAVCVKVHVTGCEIACKPRGQVVLTISVVTL